MPELLAPEHLKAPPPPQRYHVKLADGTLFNLVGLSLEQLQQLQWEQEPAFARQIAEAPKGSAARTEATRRGYEVVCTLLDRMAELQAPAEALAMGMDTRYTRLVLEVLADLEQRKIEGGLFELGFGSGILLQAAAAAGYRVGGLEVAASLHAAAREQLPSACHEELHLGDFLATDLSAQRESFAAVYWNDVFEHIAVDEISDYLCRIHELLVPGGVLITLTPSWHMRPMDVTGDFQPARSTAIGFHLKEYRLAEVYQLLRDVGFRRVSTPQFVSLRRIYWRSPIDFTPLKIACEPFLEWLPYWAAVQCCRRLGFTCTLAYKAPRST